MALILANIRNILSTISRTSQKSFSIFPHLQLKEIKEVQDGSTLIVSGETYESPRLQYLLKNQHPVACPICASGLDIKHTDILILSQFVRSDGCMLPRRITGLCRKQQKKMSSLVTMAQKSGLMPNLNPSHSKKDPKKRYGWKKFNKYFDESTIKAK